MAYVHDNQAAHKTAALPPPAALSSFALAFIDRAACSVLWFDHNGNVIYLNAAARTLLKVADPATPLTIFDLQPHLPAADWHAHWQHLHQHGQDRLEHTLYTCDGTLIISTTTAQILLPPDPTNAPVLAWTLEVQTSATTYPLQWPASTLRLDSIQILREIFLGLPAIGYIVDNHLHLSMMSSYMAELFDLNPAETFGRRLDDVLPTAIVEPWMRHCQTVLTTGHTIETEDQIMHPDGLHVYLTARFPLFDKQGHVGAVGNLSIDITSARRTEQQLRENEQRLQTLVQLNQHLLHVEQTRVTQLEALRTTMNEISSELSLPILLRSIVERSILLTNATCAELALYDAERQVLRMMVSINMGTNTEGLEHPLSEGSMGIAARTRAPFMFHDYHQIEPRPAGYEGTALVRGIATPLLSGETLVGVLAVGSDVNGATFTAHDQELLQLFADQATIAIRNAQLYDEAHRRADEAETLRKASAAITSTLDRRAMLELVLDQLAVVVKYDSAAIQLRRDNLLEAVVGRGLPPEAFDHHFVLHESDPGYVICTAAQPVIRTSRDGSPLFEHPMFSYIKSWLGIPIKIRGTVIGIITIDRREPDAFTKRDLQLVSAFADTVAVALENTRLYEEILHLATRDSLLQIANRRHFFELAEHAWDTAQEAGQPLTAMMLDIDNFKQINDSYGHTIGDEVLRRVAGICRTMLPASTILGRYGGEEIAIIFPNTTQTDALQHAEHLRQEIAQQYLPHGERSIYVTVSLGLATYPQTQTATLEGLIDLADQGLLIAKRMGKNRVVVWTPETRLLMELSEQQTMLSTIQRSHDFSPAELLLLRRIVDQAGLSISYHRQIHELLHAFDAILVVLAQMVDMRDQMPVGHTERVADMAVALAQHIGIPATELANIRRGALLHAIGKLGIPEDLLSKIGALSESERAQVRRYPEIAHMMLQQIEFLQPALAVPLAHSEWWDGSGYPHGLIGSEIPLAARIVAVVDVWDTLCTDRPYRPRWHKAEARAYLQTQAGIQFDPQIVLAFLELLDQQEALLSS